MKKLRNIHRSEQDWRSIFEAFSQSRLTQEDFCKQNQLAPSTFAKWKKQLGLTTAADSPGFIEVPPVMSLKSESPESRLELSVALAQRFQLTLRIA